MPLEDIAHVLMNPDATVPEDMVNALYYVDETASHESMEELLDRAAAAGIDIDDDTEISAADVSVQIWLAQPMLLQRHHAETVAFHALELHVFRRLRPSERPPSSRDARRPADADAEPHGRLVREEAPRPQMPDIRVPARQKIWLLVRHGMPMRREGKHQDDGEGGIAFYRPQQHDVLIYDAETDEIGVNAGTKGERELYLEVIGEVLFGNEDYFDRPSATRWIRCAKLGPNSMAHATTSRELPASVSWSSAVAGPGRSRNGDPQVRGSVQVLRRKLGDRLTGGSLTHATSSLRLRAQEGAVPSRSGRRTSRATNGTPTTTSSTPGSRRAASAAIPAERMDDADFDRSGSRLTR